jgi:hypothetical protein
LFWREVSYSVLAVASSLVLFSMAARTGDI